MYTNVGNVISSRPLPLIPNQYLFTIHDHLLNLILFHITTGVETLVIE
jgi:hypothetical protein